MGRKRTDLKGMVFGRLTVLEFDSVAKHGHARWKCKCECGKESIVRGHHLTSGTTISCGCFLKERQRESRLLSYGESSFNALYSEYKRSAIRRNLLFDLTKVEFRILIDGDCFYCGAPPSNVFDVKTYNGKYIYNGIDRENPKQGYIINNCVSCCSICNYAKGTMQAKEFIAWVEKVYKNTRKRK